MFAVTLFCVKSRDAIYLAAYFISFIVANVNILRSCLFYTRFAILKHETRTLSNTNGMKFSMKISSKHYRLNGAISKERPVKRLLEVLYTCEILFIWSIVFFSSLFFSRSMKTPHCIPQIQEKFKRRLK